MKAELPPAPEPVAIVGMACIFPQAPDLATFWNNILGGVDAVGEPVPSWDAERHLAAGRIKTARGGWLKDLYRFDPREFGIMPNSMDGGEPDQFLALRVARDALADAGYLRPDADHRDTGIVLGHSTYLHRGQVTVVQNWTAIDQTIELLKAALPAIGAEDLERVRGALAAKMPPTNADTAPGLVPNVMTGRIANRLNLRGPNYLVDAACSSSLLAVSAAIDELRAGRSRMMIAGGVNASLPADVSAIFTQLGALSARGKVRPFEVGSDGTLLGEGLGAIVLKRVSDALADGDRIYALVRGVGQASDGRATGLLAPSLEGETLAIRRAYEGSGVDPATVSLIEAHGTGIPLGDRTEIGALKNVLGERRTPQGTVAIGSVKSMISHCIPGAGIAGLIKTALALHHRVLPPTLCDEVNPELGIDATPLYVNTEARPWIGPLGQPRRAGVDSFGFGGINTHAVVEEAPAHAARPARLNRWPYELFVLSAGDDAGLAGALRELRRALDANPVATLERFAAALAAADRGASHRLAIVAADRASLAKSIDAALKRLAEKPSATWSLRSGAWYSREPLGGKLAFLFPGEGSQYLGMFADLASCFEPVQHWLDFWCGLYGEAPGLTRTDIALPHSAGLTPERRKQLEARLHAMDVGSEAVMIGGQAMFSLLGTLGIAADAMLGHSSGESSALVASGAITVERPGQLGDFIRQLNAVYERVLGEGKIPTGALLAVGALPSADVLKVVREVGGIDVAMDNCANQLVLFGDAAHIDALQAKLVAEGGICLPLPFDRGYHTQSFGAVSAAFLDYYKSIRLVAPKVPLYSCASTERFPDSPAACRKLAAAQWSQTVRFRETLERMWHDGFRVFVEVGPSANLTAFVGDVLVERPHLALASNQRRRHGLEQLLATVGQLWVQARPVNLAALFAGRSIAPLVLGAAPEPARGVLLDNTLPVLRLADSDKALLREVAERALPVPLPSPPATTPETHSDADVVPVEDGRSRVMGDYFGVMRQFLDQQQHVLMGASAATDGESPPVGMPLLDEVLTAGDGELTALCRLDVERDAFLRDHVLSGPVSALDPDKLGLACVPLMVSVEIMAEAAALLLGRRDVRSIEDVRAFDWIALDNGAVELTVHARALDASAAEVALEQGGAVIVRARFGFEGVPSLPGVVPLAEHRAPRWNGQGIYDAGMFHGPIFRSMQQVTGWDAGGMDVALSPVSLNGFFVPGEPASLVLNPVLLDALGQLAACWTAEQVGTDFNSFPSTIERIELMRECPGDEPGIVLRGRQQAVDPAREADVAAPRRWAFEGIDARGQPILRVAGWVNVFFAVPHRFYQVRRNPLEGCLGVPFALAAAPDVLLWDLPLLEDAFCAQSSGIFLRILARALLSDAELDEWRGLRDANLRQRRQWLLGRAAVKEAVREWVQRESGARLHPADIEVLHDELGAPWVDGWWVGQLAEAPSVSLSHDSVRCIAAVAAADRPIGVDSEDLARRLQPELLEGALAPSERDWLLAQPESMRTEALLRLWCAKESTAKCLRTGLQGDPPSFVVSFGADSYTSALVRCNNIETEVVIERSGNAVVALAGAVSVDASVT